MPGDCFGMTNNSSSAYQRQRSYQGSNSRNDIFSLMNSRNNDDLPNFPISSFSFSPSSSSNGHGSSNAISNQSSDNVLSSSASTPVVNHNSQAVATALGPQLRLTNVAPIANTTYMQQIGNTVNYQTGSATATATATLIGTLYTTEQGAFFSPSYTLASPSVAPSPINLALSTTAALPTATTYLAAAGSTTSRILSVNPLV